MATRRVSKGQQRSAAQVPFEEIGISGLQRYGAISRVYEEFLRELQGPAGMKLLREQLDNCPITGAMMFAVQYLARGVTFRLDVAENKANVDSTRAAAVAERIKATLFDDLDVTWPDLLSEILSMCGFGWSLHEMVFKRCLGMTPPPSIDAATGRPRDGSALVPESEPGKEVAGPTGQGAPSSRFAPSRFNDGWLGFRSLGLRAQETIFMWEFDENSRAKVMQQMAPPDYRIRRIPMSKCLHFRTQVAKENPEGRSLIRNAVTSYLYKKNIQNIESIGVERDLVGYPVFKTIAPDPAKNITVKDLWNTKDANMVQTLAKLQAMTRSIRRDEQEGMVLPYWLDLSLVSAGGARRQFDTSAIITRYEQRIAMSVLADFIMLGHEAVGSKALASTKSALFTSALNSILDNVCAVFNRYAFPTLMALNGVPTEYTPKLAHGDVENIPIEALGNYVKALAGAGMPLFPDADLEEALRDAAKLPDTAVVDPERAMESDESEQEQGPRPQAVAVGPQPLATAATARKRVRKLIERDARGRVLKVHAY